LRSGQREVFSNISRYQQTVYAVPEAPNVIDDMSPAVPREFRAGIGQRPQAPQ
jgi:hypothetical protein